MKSEKFIIRTDKEFKDKVIELAEDKGVTLSTYVRMVLKEKIKESEVK